MEGLLSTGPTPSNFILDALSESKIVFRGFMIYRIQQKKLSICLHHSQSQEMPSNAMARESSAAAVRTFPWGGPRRKAAAAVCLSDVSFSDTNLSPTVWFG